MPARHAKPPKPVLLHGGNLKSRGWTAALIERFAPPPDSSRNTRYGTVVRLWRPETIAAIESTEAFKVAHAEAARRKESARKAVETKLAAMERWVDELDIELPDIDDGELVRYACRHYNDRGLDRLCAGRIDHFREATPESDPRFLERIAVNFLRHVETDYEGLLDSTFGRTGGHQAKDKIRAKVLDAIAAKWPALAGECGRQKRGG